jgi:hypothetical protein
MTPLSYLAVSHPTGILGGGDLNAVLGRLRSDMHYQKSDHVSINRSSGGNSKTWLQNKSEPWHRALEHGTSLSGLKEPVRVLLALAGMKGLEHGRRTTCPGSSVSVCVQTDRVPAI